MLLSRRSVKMLTALANMTMRGASLLCRLGLTFYIAYQLGLEAVALYGFTVGAAAIMTAVSGLGIAWRITRFVTTESTIVTVARVRDRIAQRLVVQFPIIFFGGGLAAGLWHVPMRLVLPAAVIVMLEPIVVELHEACVFRHRSLIGNFILFLRSGSWIPVVVALGFLDAQWRTLEMVLLGWALGLIIAIGFVLVLGLWHAAAWQGVLQPIDWRWIRASGTSSPIVFMSDLGVAGLLYGDRYIVALMLGDRAAGTFTFIWSIINAVVPIVQGGVFNQMIPQLASQWHRRQWQDWLTSFDAAMRHTTWMSIGLGISAMLAALVLLRTAYFPLSISKVAFAGLMTIATVVRLRADILHHALYSAEQDSDWIAVNILSLVLGPVMALIGIGLFGFIGAGVQMVVVAFALYTMRLRLLRRAMEQAQLAARDQGGR